MTLVVEHLPSMCRNLSNGVFPCEHIMLNWLAPRRANGCKSTSSMEKLSVPSPAFHGSESFLNVQALASERKHPTLPSDDSYGSWPLSSLPSSECCTVTPSPGSGPQPLLSSCGTLGESSDLTFLLHLCDSPGTSACHSK